MRYKTSWYLTMTTVMEDIISLSVCFVFVPARGWWYERIKTSTRRPAKRASVTDSTGWWDSRDRFFKKKEKKGKKAIQMTVINLEKSTNPCQSLYNCMTVSTQMPVQGQRWPVSSLDRLIHSAIMCCFGHSVNNQNCCVAVMCVDWIRE